MEAPPRLLEEPYRSRAVPPVTARYLSWLFAASECREPLLGIYALTAEWRALIDPATEPSAARLKLTWWSEEIRRLNRGAPLHPISRYLAALPRAPTVDFEPLEATLEAAARQIAGAPLERGSELEPHAAALFANPLVVAAHLAREPSSEPPGKVASSLKALAAGLYLAAAIADYRREALNGRVVFPVDELLVAQIENADLTAAEPPLHLQSYLTSLRRRAVQLFAAAADALPRAEHAALRHVLILAALGATHLNSPKAAAGRLRLRDLYLAWSTARLAARPGS
ncbi:MAG TPA: squalene/phytoene synthase family protein [Steroidobacteraceae bacterium]|nr:squalene/phytoene synthase family protein [Steroidobacteraceae bacterium]